MESKIRFEPKNGETRIIEKFLLFPKDLPISMCSSSFKTKWLQKVKIFQKYIEFFGNNYGDYICDWQDQYWVE